MGRYFWTKNKANGNANVWYPNGDMAAEVYSNAKINKQASDVADAICAYFSQQESVGFDSAASVVKKCLGERAKMLTDDEVGALSSGFYDAFVHAIAESVGIHRDATKFYAEIATMVRLGGSDEQIASWVRKKIETKK